MEKNTILAIVLSTVVLMASFFIQYKFFPPAEVPAEQQTEIAADSSSDAVNAEQTLALEQAADAVFVQEEESSAVEEQTYTIRTNVAEVVFTNRGGDIISYKLLNHKDNGEYLQMADNVTDSKRAFSVALGGAESAVVNEIFNTKVIDDHTIGFYKKLAVKNANGTDGVFTLIKQYTFKDDEYLFKLDVIVDGDESFYGLNFNNNSYTLCTPPQIGPYYDQKGNKYEYRNFFSYSGERKKKQMVSPGKTQNYDKPYTWIGVAGKYFTVLVAPASQNFSQALYSMRYDSKPDYSNAQVYLTRGAISGQKNQDSFYVYLGPRTEKMLKRYNNVDDNAWKVSGLRLNDCMESSGLLGWLEVFLKWIMELLYVVVPNWGVSIILMTILLKVALFPLTKKQSLSSVKMQEIQPRMQALQEKYKNQPEKLNQEMAKLYQETGYNPMTGCLPMLIQFPIIFAMYNLFNNYFEFRGAMFIPGWIPDLSVGDKVLTFGFNIPLLGNELHILPIVYVVSQLIFTKITSATTPQNGANASMKYMMYGMPIFFFFIVYNAPSGLILYWTLSNFLQLFQQMFINRIMKQKKEENASNNKSGSQQKISASKKGVKK